MSTSDLWQDLERIRERAPLVHNITNFVVMNTTANALLAIGASPVMAHAIEEVEEMVNMAQALVINIGTLSADWIDSMMTAARAARKKAIPIVLDPVGCGATRFRTAAVEKLLQESPPTIIRGNASEIMAVNQTWNNTKGVDSTARSEQALSSAQALSRSCQCVVTVSGAVDLIVQDNSIARVWNGHPMMPRVTGLGCTATAITGAFAAINASPFQAAAHAMALMGIAGEIAGERSPGPGSFQINFLDVLHAIQESDIRQRLKMEMP